MSSWFSDTGLRNRKGEDSAADKLVEAKAKAMVAKSEAEKKAKSMSAEEKRVARMITEASNHGPPFLIPYVQKAAPVVAWIFVIAEALLPYMVKFAKLCFFVYSLLPITLIEALTGLITCFFGGMFPTLIAASEAFTQSGWETTKSALVDLYEEGVLIAEESAKDDKVDDDGDGIADVDQISDRELYARKVKLVLKKSHPGKIDTALGGLYTSWIAVAAVLKLQFARTIALAVSIGNKLRPIMSKILVPAFTHLMPADYHQWVPIIINYICKVIGMSVAWYIQRVLSAFHSAIRGGLMFFRALIKFASQRGWTKINHEDTMLDEYLGWTLAAFGFYFQFTQNFTLPFPMNLLLWPFTALEWFIEWKITGDLA